PEFLNWLQGKYRDVIVETNQSAIIAFMNESFSPIDTPNTYAKRIRSLAQGHVYAEILSYLYNHLPDALEIRVRIAAPADLDAFFNKLRNKWYENIAVRLDYTGDITNPIAIHGFIESNLTRRLGGQTQYLRRDHFGTGQVKKVTKTTKSSPK
ncbi:9228_t:CDS:2, partial [Rhizophagus irregularis]